jgi:site-specific recombinase XerD
MEMRELSKKSIYSYICDIKAWFRYLYLEQFNPCVLDLTEDDIEEHIFYCKKQGNNTERTKRRLASLSAFYKFLRKKKLITENPMEFIARPKKGLPVVTQTFLTEEQVKLMREKLDECGDLQLKTFALFALSTMARVNALSNVTWKQIDFENRTVDDVLEKEGKIVTLFFSEEVKELLLKIKEQREKDNIVNDYVFLNYFNNQATTNVLTDWTKKIGEMIDVPELHPHDYRHSGATLLKNKGMAIEEISFLLSHSGIDVTRKHYIKEDKSKIGKNKDKYEI